MSHHSGRGRGAHRDFPRKKGPHHLILARGDRVRSFAVRPGLILFGALALLTLVGGAAATAAFYYLQQENPQQLAAEAAVRQGYEIRIADLSRQIDSLLSREMAERSAIDEQMAALAARQQALNDRQRLLTGLATDAIRVGIDALPALAPLPVANPLRGTTPENTGIGGPVDPITTGAIDPARNDPAARLATLNHAAEFVERDQVAALATLAAAVDDRTARLASALSGLGYRTAAVAGRGGPLVPIAGEQTAFAAVAADLAAYTGLQRFARGLPLGRPIAEFDITSPYGPRSDPFLGQSAMHTGIDLAAITGTAVRATAPGTVVLADYNGGYGKMVEIDHGNGITTAYAHLNTILVEVGDVVPAGAIVGRSGSTGRSTGPHLHYEIRRDGRTIDPMAHLLAGPAITPML